MRAWTRAVRRRSRRFITVLVTIANICDCYPISGPAIRAASNMRRAPCRRFPPNDIISLVGTAPRHDLGESVGPALRLAELLDGQPDLGELRLGYGTADGDPRLRQAIADLHGVGPDDVVTTIGGMH